MMDKYAIGPMLDQAVRWSDSWDDATDVAQFLADEYLIPHFAWSVKSMEPTERGDHRQVATCYPQVMKRRRGRG